MNQERKKKIEKFKERRDAFLKKASKSQNVTPELRTEFQELRELCHELLNQCEYCDENNRSY